MIVPRCWSEAKETLKRDKRQFTIKRFGWSDIDEASAKQHAEQRVSDVISELKKGNKVRRIDHKVPYNGAEGLPIREEIIEEHGDIVITRNSYGALCLNTPNVLFADIDFENEPNIYVKITSVILVFLAAFVPAYWYQAWWILLAGLILYSSVVSLLHGFLDKVKGGEIEHGLKVIRVFSLKHPHLNLRIYRTPNGYRVLVMNQLFKPKEESTIDILNELNSDRVYVAMCRNQNCFRARVSAKPWRIGIDRIRPSPGVWPIKQERMSERSAWVKNYEDISADYAACKFIEHCGSDVLIPETKRVQELHDKLCKASQSELSIA
jgi:hypothetical protein